MPEQNAHVPEVLIGEIAERRDANTIFDKALCVLGHAELFEPVHNLPHRPPRGLAFSNLHQQHEISIINTLPLVGRDFAFEGVKRRAAYDRNGS